MYELGYLIILVEFHIIQKNKYVYKSIILYWFLFKNKAKELTNTNGFEVNKKYENLFVSMFLNNNFCTVTKISKILEFIHLFRLLL